MLLTVKIILSQTGPLMSEFLVCERSEGNLETLSRLSGDKAIVFKAKIEMSADLLLQKLLAPFFILLSEGLLGFSW